ncbi:hypothetical protein FB451DRAFT_1180543 [Mycena latifolia]|nr:hypothetical protein FB451DRAFT_1180543 [Mycena latifolia]
MCANEGLHVPLTRPLCLVRSLSTISQTGKEESCEYGGDQRPIEPSTGPGADTRYAREANVCVRKESAAEVEDIRDTQQSAACTSVRTARLVVQPERRCKGMSLGRKRNPEGKEGGIQMGSGTNERGGRVDRSDDGRAEKEGVEQEHFAHTLGGSDQTQDIERLSKGHEGNNPQRLPQTWRASSVDRIIGPRLRTLLTFSFLVCAPRSWIVSRFSTPFCDAILSMELKLRYCSTASATLACRASSSRSPQAPARPLLAMWPYVARTGPRVRPSILVHRFPPMRGRRGNTRTAGCGTSRRIHHLCRPRGHDSEGALAADERTGEFGGRDAHGCSIKLCALHATGSCGDMGLLYSVAPPLGLRLPCIPHVLSFASPPTLSSLRSARAPSAGHIEGPGASYGVSLAEHPVCTRRVHATATWHPAWLLNARRTPARTRRRSSPFRLSPNIRAVQICRSVLRDLLCSGRVVHCARLPLVRNIARSQHYGFLSLHSARHRLRAPDSVLSGLPLLLNPLKCSAYYYTARRARARPALIGVWDFSFATPCLLLRMIRPLNLRCLDDPFKGPLPH